MQNVIMMYYGLTLALDNALPPASDPAATIQTRCGAPQPVERKQLGAVIEGCPQRVAAAADCGGRGGRRVPRGGGQVVLRPRERRPRDKRSGRRFQAVQAQGRQIRDLRLSTPRQRELPGSQ